MTLLLPVLVLLAALTGGGTVSAQIQGGRGAGVGSASSSTESASRWVRLPAPQKAALQPLAAEWDSLDEAHRRKWMAMARNFDRMSEQEQATLHSRMTEWAALSPRERVHARLNFAEVQRLAPEDERKAKWEAYQALSDAERKALAERAAPPPRGTALPLRPVPRERLAPVPPAALQSGHGGPRIALTPPPRTPSTAAAVPAAAPPAGAAPAAAPVNAPMPAPPPADAAPSSLADTQSPDAPTPGHPVAP